MTREKTVEIESWLARTGDGVNLLGRIVEQRTGTKVRALRGCGFYGVEIEGSKVPDARVSYASLPEAREALVGALVTLYAAERVERVYEPAPLRPRRARRLT